LSWKDIEEYLANQDLILLPIGSIEQHGPHLPLATDSIIAQYTAQRAAMECEVLVAPVIKYAISLNHIDFPGTLSLQPETLIQVAVDVCRCLSHHGFKKILIVNGHGGNNATIDVAIIKLKGQLRDTIIGQVYPGHLPKECEGVLEDDIRAHADEGETSRILAAAPQLVDMKRAKQEIPFSSSRLFSFQTSKILSQTTSYGLPRTKSVTQSGIFGNALLATPEKGKKLFEGEIKELVREIERLKAVDMKDYTEGGARLGKSPI
jgi:creatinine amidohydrolase